LKYVYVFYLLYSPWNILALYIEIFVKKVSDDSEDMEENVEDKVEDEVEEEVEDEEEEQVSEYFVTCIQLAKYRLSEYSELLGADSLFMWQETAWDLFTT